MIALTPSVVTGSRLIPGVFAFAPLLVGNVALAYALHALTPLAGFVVIGTFGVSMYLWWLPLKHWISEIRAGLPLVELRAKLTARPAHRSDTGSINGVTLPTWVFSLKDHEQKRPSRRLGQPAAPQPMDDYRLCVTKRYLNGTDLQVGYSDGTTRGWFPTEKALCQDYRQPAQSKLRYLPRGPSPATALLNPLVQAVAARRGQSLGEILGRFLDADPTALMHACRAAALWGLIESVERHEFERLFALVSSTSRPTVDRAVVQVEVTPAGRFWLECSPDALKQAERKRQMDQKRRASYVFQGPVQGVHTGDHYGDNNFHQTNYAEGDVVEALRLLLKEPEIWAQEDLVGERTVIETAVADGQVTTPAVRSATRRALEVADSLQLAIAGNALYDILKHFVGL